MAGKKDVFDAFEEAINARPNGNPWSDDGRFQPDETLLSDLVGIPVGAGSGSESGRLAKGIDAWVAFELRRAGFARDLALFIEGLPASSWPLPAGVDGLPVIAAQAG